MEAAVTRNPDKRLTSPREVMQRLSRSLSRFETQDIKTQPQFNHYLGLLGNSMEGGKLFFFLIAFQKLEPWQETLQPLPSLSLHTAAVRLTFLFGVTRD